MASKASDALILIIEKQYASWGLMVIALSAMRARYVGIQLDDHTPRCPLPDAPDGLPGRRAPELLER